MDANTLISSVSAVAAMSGALVMVMQAKANRRKTEAEATNIQAVTGLEGARVVKDISEAAAFLVVPYKNENAELRTRLDRVESELNQIKDQYKLTLEQLHREREQAAVAQQAYEDRTKDLVRSYESRIAELKESLDEVRAQVVAESLRRNGMVNGESSPAHSGE